MSQDTCPRAFQNLEIDASIRESRIIGGRVLVQALHVIMVDSTLMQAFDAFFDFRRILNTARGISLTLRCGPFGSEYVDRCRFSHPGIYDREHNSIVCFYFDLSDMIDSDLHLHTINAYSVPVSSGRRDTLVSASNHGSNLMVFGAKDFMGILSSDEVIGLIDPINGGSRMSIRRGGEMNSFPQTTVHEPNEFWEALRDALPWQLGRHAYLPVFAIECRSYPVAVGVYEIIGVFLVPMDMTRHISGFV